MTVGCLDFGGSSVKVGVAAGTGAIAGTTVPVTGASGDLDAALAVLGDLGRVDGAIAVAVPGLVSPDGRRMLEAHGKYAWMLDADLAGEIERRAGVPVLLENDARAALIGECASGVASGERDVVALVLGTGIGTAAMIAGVPLRGPDGSAGILAGHLTIDRSGPRCVCGNLGCAEVFGGSWALPARLAAAGAASTDVRGFAELFPRADQGDGPAAQVLDEAITAWAITAVSLCHAYDPRVVVLAGGAALAAHRFVDRIARHLDEHLWRTIPRPRLLVSEHPETSVLQGLAHLGGEMENA